jgi:hypothetical protein
MTIVDAVKALVSVPTAKLWVGDGDENRAVFKSLLAYTSILEDICLFPSLHHQPDEEPNTQCKLCISQSQTQSKKTSPHLHHSTALSCLPCALSQGICPACGKVLVLRSLPRVEDAVIALLWLLLDGRVARGVVMKASQGQWSVDTEMIDSDTDEDEDDDEEDSKSLRKDDDDVDACFTPVSSLRTSMGPGRASMAVELREHVAVLLKHLDRVLL